MASAPRDFFRKARAFGVKWTPVARERMRVVWLRVVKRKQPRGDPRRKPTRQLDATKLVATVVVTLVIGVLLVIAGGQLGLLSFAAGAVYGLVLPYMTSKGA